MMRWKFGKVTRFGVAVVLIAGLAGVFTAGGATAARAVRGFDGTTITVAAIGTKAQFPGVPTGVQARLKRFNDTNEIKGVTIKFVDFADDRQDPATMLSESRRLVTEEGIFAIVGDVSANNPADYFEQQHVPYFGWGFDDTYCSNKPTTSLWGFSYNGCLVASDPSWMGDVGKASYEYVSKKTGKQHPTLVVFGNDMKSGKNAVKFSAVAYQGAGFKIAATQNKMPQPPIADYTPYAQAVLTGDHGHAPDAALCALAVDCIPMWNLMKANGFRGTFISGLYSNVIVKPMAGSAAIGSFVNPLEDTPGMRLIKKDLDGYEPGSSAKLDSGMIAAYSAADMFIQALKTVAKKGKSSITPENVQKAAATQTWEIKGLAGPTTYPQSTVFGYPACFSVFLSDGTQWNTVAPYTCSTKKIKPVLKTG